ncbi:MAG: restriction endonuclease subunit S, partial [Prevotellaceae bacterium]|nr:restriction endonuclease subunit S [Candidatus Faecinaster equi]
KEKYLGMQGFTTKPSDIIVSCAGTIGECYQLPTDAPLGIINQALMRVELYILDMADYWMLFFEDMLNHNVAMKGAGSAIKNIPPFEILKNILVPLPPLAEQHRIVAKIEELMPLVEEYGVAQEKLNRLNEALPETLKKSILQQAMQGKLVPQDANDEPASALLARLRKEKEQLVKSGKLKKKDLATTPITDEEKPFEIPESWEWVRLNELFHIVSARRVHQKDWRSSGIPFYRTREIGWLSENKKVSTDLFIEEKLFNEFSKTGCPIENDIMMTAVGTIGKTYIVKKEDKFYYKDASVLCLENFSKVNPQFYCYLFDSSYFKEMAADGAMGTTVATITMVRANEYLVPLPPLAEQHRIVVKIEELMKLVDGMK